MDNENEKMPSETNLQVLNIPADDGPCESPHCHGNEESSDSIPEPGVPEDSIDSTAITADTDNASNKMEPQELSPNVADDEEDRAHAAHLHDDSNADAQ